MADAKDFLFEIGTEEMPSAPLNNAVKQLGTMIAKGLDEAGLAPWRGPRDLERASSGCARGRCRHCDR